MRDYLKPGTRIRVSGNIIYTITGEPIGEGGGSILYPALRSLPDKGGYRTSPIRYAVKECYPDSGRFEFQRNDAGEICPSGGGTEAARYLERLKSMQREEGEISGKIYQKAFRLTPIIEAYSQVELSFDKSEGLDSEGLDSEGLDSEDLDSGAIDSESLDSGDFHPVSNQISVMELLSDKGESLRRALGDRKRLNVREAFEVIRQVLFAVEEVHRAGYLHLDIQDGNVFIKGVLDRGDNMITLLDFGAARPVLSDGLCAEIADRVIYSTRGFSAPEILYHNDGHLRLGRQADLYSIGCLLLVLLTGHRYTTAELAANRTGRFIPAFAVRKTGCPRHLVPKMQAILAKALQNDPAMRYGTAGEMLADVEEMRKLLAPHTDPLTAAQFDAFLCYAHGEKENAAALALRDSLERYRDSAFGERKIRRVFLDTGELSSCADYGESIKAALTNSEWLIVLLSKRAKESRWVGEEIRTFLAHHDPSRVLAVILEGEPGEVFPEALRESGLTEDNLLAADARAEERRQSDSTAEERRQIERKIRGDVTLRIAAPILNTTYEALRQRDRLYRMKRGFAAATVALCALAGFLGYAAVKANRIAEQQRQIAEQESLIAQKAQREADLQKDRQAELLSAQAQDFYDKKEYGKAAESALASLELTETGCHRRSVMKKLLIECLNLYVQPEEAADTIVPTGVFREITGSTPKACFLNSEGTRLFMIGDRKVSVFDTAERRLVSSLDSAYAPAEQMYTEGRSLLNEEDGQLILWSDREIVCFGYESGEVIWKKEAQGEEFGQVLVHAGRGSVYVLFRSGQSGQIVIEERNLADGALRGEHTFEAKERKKPFGFACDLSDDGRYIACICTETKGQADRAEMVLRIYDLGDDILTERGLSDADPWGSYRTEKVLFADGGRVLAAKYDGPVNVRKSADEVHYADRIGAKNFRISCYEAGSGERAWSYAETDADLRGLWEPQIRPVRLDGVSAVVAAVGNTVLILGEEDGRCLRRVQLDSAIVYWDEVGEGWAGGGVGSGGAGGDGVGGDAGESGGAGADEAGGALRFVLDSGEILYLPKTLDMQECRGVRSFPAGTAVLCADASRFYTTGEAEHGTVIRYERGLSDDSYQVMAEAEGAALASAAGDDRVTRTEYGAGGGAGADAAGEGGGAGTGTGADRAPGIIEVRICGDGTSFEIETEGVKKVSVGRDILTLSLLPDGAGIFVGLQDKVRLYGCDGALLGEAELPRGLLRSEAGSAQVYFPERDALCYTDSGVGYLIDVYDQGIEVVRPIRNVVGFDHDKGAFVLRSGSGREIVYGRLRYRTLAEIMRQAGLWCQAP